MSGTTLDGSARPTPRAVLTGLAGSCHPAPTVAVTALATAYAVSVGLEPGRTLLVAVTVLTGQLSIGWCNDLVDAGRDRTVGRTDKPLATGAVGDATVRVACVVALALTVVLSLANGLLAGLAHLLLVASGWAYDLGVKATAWSWVPYAIAFGVLPAFVTLSGLGTLPPATVVAAAALLGVGGHLLNVLPDLADDDATGVRGMPHRIGERASRVLAVVVLVASTALLVPTADGAALPLLVAVGVVVATLAVVALVGRGRAPFLAAVGIAAADVLLLVLG